MATVSALREFALVLALDGDVQMNSEGVSIIDSAGLGLFASLAASCFERAGRRLAIRKPSGNCYRLFQLAGLTDYLDIEPADSASSR